MLGCAIANRKSDDVVRDSTVRRRLDTVSAIAARQAAAPPPEARAKPVGPHAHVESHTSPLAGESDPPGIPRFRIHPRRPGTAYRRTRERVGRQFEITRYPAEM